MYDGSHGEVISQLTQESRQPNSPGVSLGSQAGFGMNWGQAYIGAGGLSSQPNSINDEFAGSAALGMGFGNSRETIGFEIDIGIGSINPSDGGIGEDGFVGAKVHRMISSNTSISLGIENFANWGNAKGGDSNVYGAASSIFFLQPDDLSNPMPIVVSAGLGTGRFRTLETQGGVTLSTGNQINPFGAIGFIFHPQMSVIADYTSNIFNAGMSFVPVRSWPVTLTLYAYDLGQSVDTSKFAGSLAYVFNF
jgi:hypothetical protein